MILKILLRRNCVSILLNKFNKIYLLILIFLTNKIIIFTDKCGYKTFIKIEITVEVQNTNLQTVSDILNK